ncbi:MAG: hypothetical protein ACKO3M_04395 [Rubrivivax sp.]
MSDEDLGFAPPPFNAEHALAQMKRALRDAKLAERGPGFELRGRRVAELMVNGPAIEARLARRPALSPDWDRHTLKNAAEQRRWLDELKSRLTRWESGED